MNMLTRSKNYKAFCGAVFAFLVCSSSFAPVSVYADDSSDLLSELQDWDDGVSDKADALLTQYANASGDPSLQASYYAAYLACTAWHSANAYTKDMLLGFDLETVPASDIYFGWYTYNNEIYSGSLYVYGQNGDFTRPLNPQTNYSGSYILPVFSSDLFSVGFKVVDYPKSNYNMWRSSVLNGYVSYRGVYDPTPNHNYKFTVFPSAIFSELGYASYTYYTALPFTSTVTLTNDLGNYFKLQSDYGPSALIGPLDSDHRIYTDHFTLSETNADINDISTNIYNTLINIYPEIEDIWTDPGEVVAPTGFDNLTFPPYIPEVDFHDVEVPTETLPTGLTDGAGFWFSAFSNMVEAFNLKSFVILFLCIMLAMVILKI